MVPNAPRRGRATLLPAVQPVNFILDRGAIVMKTSPTSRLATAAADTIVALEIDEFGTEARTGWSVVAVGHAHRVTDPAAIASLEALPLESWAPGRRDTFIRIRPELITGRRIGSPTRPDIAS
ncbi:pyridoxamine 5'-phosphate oxidase family protein [Actinomadura madurae]|uniref:pyridoxamine 5'-phosphate oxidase family protein n=1 Tax=Actinomadura madurae TaxID=1993 RepID=UPI000D9C36B7|nr:pyridoxamine 5'-phosphate oxidase family protein [Actinomadura madurae]SPT51228.1 Pyridoxamine 5'-phosphate oxidase [Actinomadura madurae]